jgi:hypothetical protein
MIAPMFVPTSSSTIHTSVQVCTHHKAVDVGQPLSWNLLFNLTKDAGFPLIVCQAGGLTLVQKPPTAKAKCS